MRLRTWPNALQRTRPSRRGCNRRASPPSLVVGHHDAPIPIPRFTLARMQHEFALERVHVRARIQQSRKDGRDAKVQQTGCTEPRDRASFAHRTSVARCR